METNMSKLSTGLKSIANKSLTGFNAVARCTSRMANGLNTSYRYTKIGCKKLQRKLKAGICQITERNRDMAQDTYIENARRARAQAEENNEKDLMMIMMAFMMMFETLRPRDVFTYHAAPSYDMPEPTLG
jgi:hypothetical protein